MMTFEELKPHVCALEQGQELDKLGLPVNSIFAWIIRRDNTATIIKTDEALKHHSRGKTKAFYAAWLDSELGVLIKKIHKISSGWLSFEALTEGKIKHLTMRYNSRIFELGNFEHEAHYKAAAVIECVKQKIIKPEDLTL